MINKACIHIARPTEKNPYVVVIAYGSNQGEIGTFERCFSRKRISIDCVAQRDMTTKEIEYANKCWRILYYRYKSWEGLIEDEMAITGDKEWCNKLAVLGGLKTE